jgi:predicted DNA-binding transcriptional regulator YafY
MPANKNALIRYKTIDACLRNRYRRYTLDDLVDACCNALYEAEGITKGVSVRTVQGDLQMMRSDKLGYNAPIEVYDHKYYRYEDPEFSITGMPMSQNDYEVMKEAVDMLRQLQDFDQFSEMADIIGRLQDKLMVGSGSKKPIINFDCVPNLKGLKLLNPLYNYIAHKQTIKIQYRSFKNDRNAREFILCPYLLKEFRNRWFVFGSKPTNLLLFNLALDRIEHIEPVDVPFRENPDFDPEHFFDDVIGVSKNIKDCPKLIKFWANAKQSKYILTKPIHTSQTLIKQNPDGTCIFQIEVIINYELFSVFMSYGSGVKIISPRSVVSAMQSRFKEAVKLYDTFIEE